jgi:hypothetical protein
MSGKAIIVAGAGSGRIIAYSLTTLTLSTGTTTATVTSTQVSGALTITTGQTLRISELGFRANFMQGTVTSYDSGTGALVMNITSAGGKCGTLGPANTMNSNCKRWLISTIPSTVITNNSSEVLFTITESTAGHIDISGVQFAAGTGASDFYLTRTSGGQAILLRDLWIQHNGGTFTNIDGDTSRGVIWNTSFDSSPFSSSNGQVFRTKDANGSAMPTSWTTASTMGTADTTGQNNFYIESSDFHAYLALFDYDDMSRTVFRYNFLNNAGGASHGADTSNFGMRHFEFYNNVGIFQAYTDGTTANMNWWIFIRGGTHVIHDNVLPLISSQDWGTKGDIIYAVENLGRNAGPHACWGEGGTNGQYYWAPRQVGMGRVTGTGTTTGPQVNCVGTGCISSNRFSGSTDAYTYVGDSEPAYLWNNKRPAGTLAPLSVGFATAYTDCTGADSQSNYVQANRDYFNSASTAKPGYTPYTYPHPLTLGGTPSPPTNLQAVPQ